MVPKEDPCALKFSWGATPLKPLGLKMAAAVTCKVPLLKLISAPGPIEREPNGALMECAPVPATL